MTDPNAREELRQLVRSFAAYAERMNASGATEVPRATTALLRERLDDSKTETLESEGAARSTETNTESLLPGSSSPPAVATLDLSERKRVLELLADEVRACTACGLHRGRKQTVFARGEGTSGLCFVGEGPGADEDAQGYPFVGAAGQLLDRMIVAMGLSREEVYVCNVVKCRPPDNRKPEPNEVAACLPFLHAQLETIAPSVIVALGATAAQALLGTSVGILRLRGTWRLYRGRIAVMPTFHPAYLLRKPEAKREAWQDLQAVAQHLGRPIPRATKG